MSDLLLWTSKKHGMCYIVNCMTLNIYFSKYTIFMREREREKEGERERERRGEGTDR